MKAERNQSAREKDLMYSLSIFQQTGLTVHDLSKGGFLREGDYLLQLMVEGFDLFKPYHPFMKLEMSDASKKSEQQTFENIERQLVLRMYPTHIYVAGDDGRLKSVSGKPPRVFINKEGLTDDYPLFLLPQRREGIGRFVDLVFELAPAGDNVSRQWNLDEVIWSSTEDKKRYATRIVYNFPDFTYYSIPGNSPNIKFIDDIFNQKLTAEEVKLMMAPAVKV